MGDDEHNDAPTFRLSPVSPDLLALAVEAWAIEARWWTAFYDGRATQETRPALPTDRYRHNELNAILKRRLEIDPRNYIRVRGAFWTADGWDPRGLMKLRAIPNLDSSLPRPQGFRGACGIPRARPW